ncbi:MAG: hypothetical protein KF778_01380 [Rhodocyclaceae bacterium]|nr:hypothetical protein [Rhodocyclaceae bacterium]MBX3667026.1 hypothetical protein [Rhodocyclaceae bacterium]
MQRKNSPCLPRGYVAFIGSKAANTGSITSPGGITARGVNSNADLTQDGDTRLTFQVNGAAVQTLDESGGLIQAASRFIVSARARGSVLDTVVSNSRTIRAQAVCDQGGVIELRGVDRGSVRVAGTLDVLAPAGGNGGFLKTSGACL